MVLNHKLPTQFGGETMAERLSLIYDGGMATEGQLDFYEYGRAAYAFARFVTTIEYFRQTETVPRKILKQQNVGIVIEAPEKGSFPVDVIIPVALTLTTELSKVPLEIFIQYIVSQIQRIFPGEEAALLEAARVQLGIEKERTKQSKEETKRIQSMEAMVRDQNLNHKLALEMIDRAMQAQTKALSAMEDVNVQLLKEKLELMSNREKTFEAYQRQLETIPSEKLIRLASKVRPQVAAMGVPLRKSARVMKFASGPERKVIAKFDAEEIKDINSRDLDEEVAVVEASFRAYDRDTGIGKMDLPQDNLRRVTFSVPPGDRTVLRPKILAAIDQDAVTTTVLFFRDKSKAITSAIIQDIEV
jgi:hypothetical protein